MAKRLQVLKDFEHTLRLEQHHFLERPDLIFQQLYNLLQWKEGEVKDIVEKAREKYIQLGRFFLHQYRKPKIKKNHLIMTLTGHTKRIVTCAFSPDGRKFVSGSDDKTLILWDAETGKLLEPRSLRPA